MKKLLALWLLLPLWTMSQTNQNVLSYGRFVPKLDKIAEFEKAITNHHQKYHTDEWKANVWMVNSGPESVSYMIALGPHTWEQLDNRKTTPEHDADWQNCLKLVDKAYPQTYMVFQDDLSTAKPGEFVEKVSVTRLYYKPGYGGKVSDAIKFLKKSWEGTNQSVAVYQAINSGEPHYLIAVRHIGGWKEKTFGNYKPLREQIGNDDFDNFIELIRDYVSKSVGEMLMMRKDLSSK